MEGEGGSVMTRGVVGGVGAGGVWGLGVGAGEGDGGGGEWVFW